MKISPAIIVVIGVLFSMACNQPPAPEDTEKQPTSTREDQLQIQKVLELYISASESQDINLMSQVWAPDDDIVVIGTEGDENLKGWNNIKPVLTKQFTSFENTLISMRDQLININNDKTTAWFSAIVNYNFIYKGKALSFEGNRFTGVLEKRNNQWLIVQSHMSIPAHIDLNDTLKK